MFYIERSLSLAYLSIKRVSVYFVRTQKSWSGLVHRYTTGRRSCRSRSRGWSILHSVFHHGVGGLLPGCESRGSPACWIDHLVYRWADMTAQGFCDLSHPWLQDVEVRWNLDREVECRISDESNIPWYIAYNDGHCLPNFISNTNTNNRISWVSPTNHSSPKHRALPSFPLQMACWQLPDIWLSVLKINDCSQGTDWNTLPLQIVCEVQQGRSL